MSESQHRHVCPWWIGYVLASPLRRLFLNPDDLLGRYIREGDTVLEVGPGMGFFTLPAARIVGSRGRVISVDIQERMVRSLRRRAEKAGLAGRIDARMCPEATLGVPDLAEAVDVVLAYAVIHEVPDAARLFDEIFRVMKPGALLLLAEPRGHVTAEEFAGTVGHASSAGLVEADLPPIRRSHAAVMRKPPLPDRRGM